MAKTYRMSLEVRGYELDSYGHVNHAVYLNYLEQARWKMLADEGVTLQRLDDWKCWPVLKELQVKYFRPTYIGEILEIQSHIVENGRTHFTVEQEIFRSGPGGPEGQEGSERVLWARIHAVMVNEKGRPTQAPEEMARLWA